MKAQDSINKQGATIVLCKTTRDQMRLFLLSRQKPISRVQISQPKKAASGWPQPQIICQNVKPIQHHTDRHTIGYFMWLEKLEKTTFTCRTTYEH